MTGSTPPPNAAAPQLDRCVCGYVARGNVGDRCPECGRGLVFAAQTPIAQYREKQFRLRREFVLYSDRIVVTARRQFGNHSQVSVPLAALNPNASILWQRSTTPKQATVIVVVGAAAAFTQYAGRTIDSIWDPKFLFAIAVTLVGLGMIIFSLGKIEYARFHDAANLNAILLDIARRGPDAATFDDFIATLRRNIEGTRATTK